MNWRGGIALVGKTLFSYTSSIGFFWTLALGWLMGPLIYMFVWLAASQEGPIAGYGQSDFILYYVGLMLVNQLTYPCSHWTIGESIQSGTLSVWLLRPLAVLYEAVASDVALKVVCFPFVVVIAAGLGFLFHIDPVPWSRVGPFLVFLVLAQIIRFMFAYTLALLSLWTQEISALLKVNDTLVFLLAGQMVPTVLLPGMLGELARLLPYRYMLGFPIEYLTGQLTGSEIMFGLRMQMGWALVSIVVQQWVWQRGIRHYTAVGG